MARASGAGLAMRGGKRWSRAVGRAWHGARQGGSVRIEQKARPAPRLAGVATSPWRLLVCGAVAAFLALGAATHTFRVYHLFLLLAVPFALFSADAGRRFFADWWPLL